MHFKLEFTVQQLMLVENASMEFSFEGPHDISVQLRHPTRDDQNIGFAAENALGVARSQRKPNSRVHAMFVRLANSELPQGSTIDPTWVGVAFDQHGHIPPDHSAPLEVLPEPIQSFVREVTDELWDYARRTAKVVRWRNGRGGPHNPFAQREVHWSFDGTDWKMMPSDGRVYISTTAWLSSLAAPVYEEIRTLVQSGRTEPLGHELYREAWEQRFVNPRSALILGIAAAEAGIKQLVTALVPAAGWLAENAPSPPLVDMLEQYLPLLPAKSKIGGKVFPPPPDVIKSLKKGIWLRNRLIHRGVVSLEYDTLDEVLSAVRDVLWLLDYYNGFDWALAYLTQETKQSLTP